jgi:hypothetical protein
VRRLPYRAKVRSSILTVEMIIRTLGPAVSKRTEVSRWKSCIPDASGAARLATQWAAGIFLTARTCDSSRLLG